jgi:hypothetical protein
MAFLTVCGLALLTAAGASAQSGAAGRASQAAPAGTTISGTVVNSATGEPLRRATVAVLSEEDSHTVESVESDSEGRFALAGLPAAKYQLTASKRGFRTAFYDEHQEYSTAIVTGEGQETSGLVFRLTPGAVLHGVVTGDGGDPVEGAKVMLFERSREHGRAPGERIAQANSTTTDDTGAYDFYDLAAGEYLLAVSAEPWFAMPRSGGGTGQKAGGDSSAALDVAYPVTFFDSVTDESSATRIVLSGGSRETASINLHAVPALRLTVETPHRPDGSVARAELRQTIFGVEVSAQTAVFMDAMQTGTVEFSGLPPGHYELSQGDPPRVAELDAALSQQVDPGLGTPTVAVSGTLRTSTGSPLLDEVTVTLTALDAAHGQQSLQTASARGVFNFPSVTPGSWELAAESSGRALPISSVTVGGRTHAGDLVAVRDRALQVSATVSLAETQVGGFARSGAKGRSGVMVVLVPTEPEAVRGLARRDQSDSDGSFSLRDVAPGTYTVVAIEDGWELDWARPEVIARYLPHGVGVTVTERSGKLVRLAEAVPVQAR